jgi:hypothetical protein
VIPRFASPHRTLSSWTVASSIVAREEILYLYPHCQRVFSWWVWGYRLRSSIRKLPRPVVVGLSTGIAVLVVGQQVPALLGIGSQIVAHPAPRAPLSLVRYPGQNLALVPQHEDIGDHLLTDIIDSLRIRGAVVLEGLL